MTIQSQQRKEKLFQRLRSAPTYDPNLVEAQTPVSQRPDAGWYQTIPVCYGPKRLWGIAIYDWKNNSLATIDNLVIVFRWKDRSKAISWCRDAKRASTG